jgi:hypothetical protein
MDDFSIDPHMWLIKSATTSERFMIDTHVLFSLLGEGEIYMHANVVLL